MIFPLKLSLEDVSRLTSNAQDVYYRRGTKFLTTKKDLLGCTLDVSQRDTVETLSDQGYVKLITVEMGTFNIDL